MVEGHPISICAKLFSNGPSIFWIRLLAFHIISSEKLTLHPGGYLFNQTYLLTILIESIFKFSQYFFFIRFFFSFPIFKDINSFSTLSQIFSRLAFLKTLSYNTSYIFMCKPICSLKKLTHKAPPIICSRQQFQILLLLVFYVMA